jgi:hypothetical protein
VKIYSGKHTITQTSKVNLDIDIPLAYIDSDFKNYNVNIIPRLIANRKSKVIPYNSYNSLDVCNVKVEKEIGIGSWGKLDFLKIHGYKIIPKSI